MAIWLGWLVTRHANGLSGAKVFYGRNAVVWKVEYRENEHETLKTNSYTSFCTTDGMLNGGNSNAPTTKVNLAVPLLAREMCTVIL